MIAVERHGTIPELDVGHVIASYAPAVDGILAGCGFAPAPPGAALIVQVSRWDPLKDPVGVMEGFIRLDLDRLDAHLALVGPDTAEVADDPEGREVFERCLRRWRSLPDRLQDRIRLVSLSMAASTFLTSSLSKSFG